MSDAHIGRDITPLVLQTGPVGVLRFGAATHNAHRIHYDNAYSRTEGLDRPVVMAQLQGTLFYRAAALFAGEPERVLSVSWKNRAPAYVGEQLTVTGLVTETTPGSCVLIMEERTESGTLCATGRAIVSL